MTTPSGDPQEILVPLSEEQASIAKRRIVTGRVQVSRVTCEHEQLLDETLAREQVEVERTPIGKVVEVPPSVREEGDTIIIPIVEEILVVERRLLLKEEVRVRRVRSSESHRERVMLRRQEAIITRDSVEPSLAGDASDETVNSNQTIQP
ncbi:MAG TPA: YsnF/AvaK domain-containing protein [Terriglobales bacterium]|nr:YsnF/AvaK domain-containing protein [Terriglobales bacterium]